jgi:hypothetical protein
MAKKSKQEELVERLHANGVRKRVATAITGARGGRRKGEKQAREVLRQLEAATEAIRDDILGRRAKRSDAAKKAARTRKRNADKRSAAAKKGAAKRTAKTGSGGARTKATAKKK